MKVVGMGVCGPNEKHLEATLKEFKRLCDETIICLCNATDKEKKLIEKYGFLTVEDNREWGKTQWLIKEEFLRNHVSKLKPDWIIPLDMDEVFEEQFNREELEKLANRGGLGYYFYIANLYDSGYTPEWSFWNIRMFKFAPEHGLEYQRKPVHPGIAPRVVYHVGNYAPFIVKHYGLQDKETRDRKVERYKLYDANAAYMNRGYYDFLASNLTPTPFNEKEVHDSVAKEVSSYHFKSKLSIMNQKKKEYVYVKNASGKVYDIPAEHLKETLARPGFELVGEVEEQPVQETVVQEEIKTELNQCQICGFIAKSAFGLKAHSKKHE